MPVPEEVTIDGQLYIFEETILGNQSGVGSRPSIEFVVGAEHVDKFVFATMADGPRTNSSSTLKIKKEWKNGDGIWQELASVGWTGGPGVGYPGIGIDSSDIGKLEHFTLVNEFGSGCDLRLGTVEDAA